tara:strand:- start:142 stop:516 length:375 start_codon:yes stop_codon:yes gene_type:complete
MKKIFLVVILFFTLMKTSISAELKFSMICNPIDVGFSTELKIDSKTDKVTYFYSYGLSKLGVGQYKIDPDQTIIKDRFISIIGIHAMRNEYVYVWYDFKNLKMLYSDQSGKDTWTLDCEKKLQL